MKKQKRPTAPAGLSAAARKLWAQIQDGYGVADPAGLAILCEALRAWDRSEQARREVEKRGVTLFDKYQQARVNPAANVERDSRAAFLSALKALKVDIPGADDGRE
jgi:phage terminase small subunit